MSGKFLLDTNAIIYALNDGLKLPKATYYTSVITEIELFSYPKLTKPDSLICATALVNDLSLISHDKQLSKIDDLKVISLYDLML